MKVTACSSEEGHGDEGVQLGEDSVRVPTSKVLENLDPMGESTSVR